MVRDHLNFDDWGSLRSTLFQHVNDHGEKGNLTLHFTTNHGRLAHDCTDSGGLIWINHAVSLYDFRHPSENLRGHEFWSSSACRHLTNTFLKHVKKLHPNTLSDAIRSKSIDFLSHPNPQSNSSKRSKPAARPSAHKAHCYQP